MEAEALDALQGYQRQREDANNELVLYGELDDAIRHELTILETLVTAADTSHGGKLSS